MGTVYIDQSNNIMPISQVVDIQLFIWILPAGVVTKPDTIRSDMNYYDLWPKDWRLG
jgi:hypothetical protein